MGFLSTILNATGLIFLIHAVYSSYEHSLAQTISSTSSASASSSSTLPTSHPLPTDIILEILLSTTLLCVGVVMGSPTLRPIQWSTWASEADKDERRKKGERAFEGEAGGVVGNPFRWVEDGERRGFWDIRGKRKEFADWVRNGSKGDAQIGS